MNDFQEKQGRATIVVGGGFGSEGKGAIAHYLAIKDAYDVAVRGGSSNAGHTIVHGGATYKNQLIPVAWPNPGCELLIAPAAIIEKEQFFTELEWVHKAGLRTDGRVFVDRNAGLISQAHVFSEEGMGAAIGSTQHGCGAALVAKMWRRGGITLAGQDPDLAKYVRDCSMHLNWRLSTGCRALLEGTQGTMLSLNHSTYYPYCTSRDATACAIANEAGIGPSRIGQVVMVIRSYPIRVGGNSGPTGAPELTWEEVARRSGNPALVPERTTVTKKVRRIFEFSPEDLATALRLNAPTQLALTFVDYYDHRDYGKSNWNDLTEKTKEAVKQLERLAHVPVTLIRTGPNFEHIIDRRNDL